MSSLILLGSNPSTSSPDNTPFHMSTRSRIIIDGWFDGIDIPNRVFMNVSDEKKENNKPLTATDIAVNTWPLMNKLEAHPDAYIVTLGKTPAKAMANLKNLGYGWKWYEMPHPSGRNRLLNDPNYIIEKIKGLKEFLSQAP